MSKLPTLAFAFLLWSGSCLHGAAGEIFQWSGETMGTTYQIKVFADERPDPDLPLLVDAELRRVNDQMSTYLKTSELTQFNQSESTDWIDVSSEVAQVVRFALGVSEKTNGAFDITVGPLVNAWSFGPGERTKSIPSADTIAELSKKVGFQKLSVRMDPPALRKTIPKLKIDLSAIAKGHGVDRVLAVLDKQGMKNVFVEIGGEVAVSGDKAGDPWRVGIQKPESNPNDVMIAHPLASGKAMATSGDYNNSFDVDGKRYSHTIDPRTGWPVDHNVTSVTIVAESCMAADAWATAINVLGLKTGTQVAKTEALDSLLVSRDGEAFVVDATGTLAKYADVPATDATEKEHTAKRNAGMLPIALLTMGILGFLVFAMAIGVLLGRKPIAGSCGGLAAQRGEDGSSCSLCSNPADACKELRERMHEKAQSENECS